MKEVDPMPSYSTPPPTPDDRAVTVIDCHTCPVRGHHCGDCFVPVLGRVWLEDPAPSSASEPRAAPGAPESPGGQDPAPQHGSGRLDSDELAAVGAFVRAGLVTRDEARGARAVLSPSRRAAAG
ncbi:hypothetical protein [uncultured Serinicoccus sp.]|uniref:hypothetical protein n=1 Tax=uncultured Serinicoccus sp. TaxID=735514 RepID=UPI00262ADB92|nr:hypothetical protein [uncultured Serinicoccus sp.]